MPHVKELLEQAKAQLDTAGRSFGVLVEGQVLLNESSLKDICARGG